MSCILAAQMRVVFFAIQIRAIISTQAVTVLGRMIAHILFFKKKEEKGKEMITVGLCSAVLSFVVCVLIQLLRSNGFPGSLHTLLNSESLYLSCLQGKMLTPLLCAETLTMLQTKLDII